jgi:hypothetical protein
MIKLNNFLIINPLKNLNFNLIYFQIIILKIIRKIFKALLEIKNF